MPTSHFNSFRRAFLYGALLLAVFVAPLAQSQSSLSSKERKEVFEYVWTVVHEKYYDTKTNGVDWKNVRNRYKERVENGVHQFLGLLLR